MGKSGITRTPGGKSKTVTMDEDGQNISKATNKVVAQMRIREIEKNVRSMSSILDTRTLYSIENVHKKQSASKKLTAAGKRSAHERRDNNTVQSSILNQGLLAAAALKAGGVKMANTTEEYGNEENIWKHKYRTPTYTQKRRFNNPKLHEYFKTLNGEEQKDFKQQCRDSLYAMSTAMRENVAEIKNKMDERGVFHPAANAHRAHCAYLLKVYKEVDAATIEDPVLKSMRRKDKFAAMADDAESLFGTDSVDSPPRESTSRGPVSRDTQSSQSKIRPAKNPRVFEKTEKKQSLASMFDRVALPPVEKEVPAPTAALPAPAAVAATTGPTGAAGGMSPGRPKSRPAGLSVRISEEAEAHRSGTSTSSTGPSTTANPPAPSRQNSRKELETPSSAQQRVASRSSTPKGSEEGVAGGEGPARDVIRRSNTTAGKSQRAQDESGNMDGFTDSHTTDWMIRRLQTEQMAAVVTSSGQHVSVPLGRDGQLTWKSLPELQHSKSEAAVKGKGARPLSPVISFSQFNDLFKSYSDQLPASAQAVPQTKPGAATGAGAGARELFVDTRGDCSDAVSPTLKVTPKLTRALSTALPSSTKKTQGGSASTSASGGTSGGNTPGKPGVKRDNVSDSQRILEGMQPHLDAFIAVNVSKKSNNIQMVQKMLAGVKKPGGMPRAATADARLSRRPGGVSEVGKVAVASQKSGNRVRAVDGFRNVFLAPESENEDSDGESAASEASAASSSDSDDSSDYDSDEEAAAAAAAAQRGNSRGKLARKKTEKKIKSKAEDSAVVQERQMAIWEVLQIRTEDRVRLMNKYSSSEHSEAFRTYFSLWSEVALLVVFRQELRKVFLWYQRGLLPVPVDNPEGGLWAFQELLRRVPAVLRGSYSPGARSKKTVRAESCFAVLERIRGLLTFEEDDEQQLGFHHPMSVLPFLHSTVPHLDRLLLDKLGEVEARLDDVVPFGSGSCREWLLGKAQKFPVLPRENTAT